MITLKKYLRMEKRRLKIEESQKEKVNEDDNKFSIIKN